MIKIHEDQMVMLCWYSDLFFCFTDIERKFKITRQMNAIFQKLPERIQNRIQQSNTSNLWEYDVMVVMAMESIRVIPYPYREHITKNFYTMENSHEC